MVQTLHETNVLCVVVDKGQHIFIHSFIQLNSTERQNEISKQLTLNLKVKLTISVRANRFLPVFVISRYESDPSLTPPPCKPPLSLHLSFRVICYQPLHVRNTALRAKSIVVDSFSRFDRFDCVDRLNPSHQVQSGQNTDHQGRSPDLWVYTYYLWF